MTNELQIDPERCRKALELAGRIAMGDRRSAVGLSVNTSIDLACAMADLFAITLTAEALISALEIDAASTDTANADTARSILETMAAIRGNEGAPS